MARPYLHAEDLARSLEAARREKRLSYKALGNQAQVDQAQAFRICTGEFRTLGANVLRICNALGVRPPREGKTPPASWTSVDWVETIDELAATWAKKPASARKLAGVLRAIRDYARD